jgi:hypothetical protein
MASPPSPGTNSSGTAQSSGAGANSQSGVTTGSGHSADGGTAAAGPNGRGNSTDAVIAEENKTIDRKLKGICRGC